MQTLGLESAALRDKDGDLAKRFGHVQIGDLRRSYGNKFAPRMNRYAKLKDVLHKLDTPSLLLLID
jgi:hypothetical protein